MPLLRKRKCENCHEFFRPDPRNAVRQKYCSKTECRRIKIIFVAHIMCSGYRSGEAGIPGTGKSMMTARNRYKITQFFLRRKYSFLFSVLTTEDRWPYPQAHLYEVISGRTQNRVSLTQFFWKIQKSVCKSAT